MSDPSIYELLLTVHFLQQLRPVIPHTSQVYHHSYTVINDMHLSTLPLDIFKYLCFT